MSVEQLERDVLTLRASVNALERKMADLQREPKMKALRSPRPTLTPEDIKVFDEIDAFGRYYRQTGRDAPDDWKPGDPIPEPDAEWLGIDVSEMKE